MMAATDKLDIYKAHKKDYASPKKPVLLELDPIQYLSIESCGRPGGEEFQNAIGALYATAYTIKMTYKTSGHDYTICKLEALWWIDDDKPMKAAEPSEIHFVLMIRTPDFIKESHLISAHEALLARGKTADVKNVVLETLTEGRCVQMLHVGPYDKETETLEQMTEYAESQGYSLSGRHHEVYLSDPRRIPPERLKTILRHPVTK